MHAAVHISYPLCGAHGIMQFCRKEKNMERGKDLWKRIASLVLSLALVLTLMPVQFAYAEGDDNTGGTEDKLPETLMYFSFDDDITDGGKVKAEIVTQDDANVPACDKSVKKVGDGALRLNNTSGAVDNAKGAYLKVPKGALANADGSGKTDLTISYWSKVAPSTGWATGWVCFASQEDLHGNSSKYIGIYDRAGGPALKMECFNGGRPDSKDPEIAKLGAEIVADNNGYKPTTDWKHVLVVMEGKALRMYINGEKKAEKAIEAGIPDLSKSTFYIGYAT